MRIACGLAAILKAEAPVRAGEFYGRASRKLVVRTHCPRSALAEKKQRPLLASGAVFSPDFSTPTPSMKTAFVLLVVALCMAGTMAINADPASGKWGVLRVQKEWRKVV